MFDCLSRFFFIIRKVKQLKRHYFLVLYQEAENIPIFIFTIYVSWQIRIHS